MHTKTKPSNISIGLMEQTTDCLKTAGKTVGDTLNNILDEYSTPEDIAAAVTRHILNPVVDPSPIKRTSVYADRRRVDALRDLAKHTYLPFDAILRILVQDYLQRHARP